MVNPRPLEDFRRVVLMNSPWSSAGFLVKAVGGAGRPIIWQIIRLYSKQILIKCSKKQKLNSVINENIKPKKDCCIRLKPGFKSWIIP